MANEPVSFQVAGQSPFIAETNGAFFVTVENRFLPASNLQQVLTSFGEVMSFEALDSDPNNQVGLIFNCSILIGREGLFSNDVWTPDVPRRVS